MKYSAILLSALFLSACSGDDKSSSHIINNEEDILSKSGVELLLVVEDGKVTNPVWKQTEGTSVDLLSKNSKVISFTVPKSGDYKFVVEYELDGKSKKDKIKFNAVAAVEPKLIARLGHSVIENGGVSLHAFADESIDKETIVWQQLSGPAIDFDAANVSKDIAIFKAPQVNVDSAIEIQVSAEDSAGNRYQDTVSVLVENSEEYNENGYFSGDFLAKIKPFNRESPYKDSLVDCVYSNTLTSSCDLNTLPILATDSNYGTPTIDQIMDRVVVSHEWMGKRFRDYLKAYDDHDDFKNLLRATTAIVISYDIRPSFYWAATGAIYLDPNTLWLTPEERDTINEAPDYRSDYGRDFNFIIPSRYVKNNDYVNYYYPTEYRYTRTLSKIKYGLADLLYHELAHANDYFPPAEWGTYSRSTRFLDAALTETEISDDLKVIYPLQSQEMIQMAAVRFMGEQATEIQKSYGPDDIAHFYEPDISNGFYNYTNEKEDLGILFEELMMSLRFGVQRDTAVMSNYEAGYMVSWGQRGRIGKTEISDRAAYIAKRLMPEFDLSLIDTLPSPIDMTKGLDWWQNLEISKNTSTILRDKNVRVIRPKVKTHQTHGRALPKH